MIFDVALELDRKTVLQNLGYGDAEADPQTAEMLEEAAKEIQQAAQPRWIWGKFALQGMQLDGTAFAMQGQDIQKHLAGCGAIYLLALTLGMQVEQQIRKAEATDMGKAVLLDSCASALIEQYADAGEALLQEQAQKENLFITGRYSPGYGDFPITSQPQVLGLLNAQRAIGLSVSGSGILLPRKSITAVIGIADIPVTGRLAGCGNCVLKEKCKLRKEGKFCGGQNTEQG